MTETTAYDDFSGPFRGAPHDRLGRTVTLVPVDEDNWRAIADVRPRDDQREHVAALAARYVLLSLREEVWNSLGVLADDEVVGHLMWGRDPDDGTYWIGGVMVDAERQGDGVGRVALRLLLHLLAERPDCREIRLSHHPENGVAARLYPSLGFVPTGEWEDGEQVHVLRPHGG
ncbi:GNAT family N-acetyltransferase [Streptomyces sp. XM4193]|uniref:GNAT family N-acetyltransferase n=1 Tax=Streptomyces sp. XM4193 TaxID=2929782 RepID=UPI001FF7D460|nr:GNAT family N-acetyltransferase [Streptomyces sp. XM4193]MCK1797661.1 GNAT family N-acetyltransferase [Streptomyces sp. XM4193]